MFNSHNDFAIKFNLLSIVKIIASLLFNSMLTIISITQLKGIVIR